MRRRTFYSRLPSGLHEKDIWGENSSYTHLADFYMDSKPDSALWYARMMFDAASKINSPDDKLAALRKLIVLVPKQSKFYFQQYQQLEDSLQAARNAAKSQFAVIRYNVEKAKTENIQLQKKNTEKKYQLLVVTLVALAGAFVGFGLYKRRKRRMQLEADRRLQESKLRLSQKGS